MGNVFDKDGNELRTAFTFHPGELLQEEVEARKLKKSDLAQQLGLLPGHLSELFKGKRHINARLAVKLEKILGVSAEYWLGLQSAYDLAEARELEQV
ncbi:MAG: HigA family addiction module antitoxin [Mucilaginibacter sp.]|uniref:HigA family addiction module antitoxin n=1 Tax=Mucilaginibacter sp. TaxID=1882438 RepID=UPI0034E54FCD